MKFFITFFALFLYPIIICGNQNDAQLEALNESIANRPHYLEQKENNLNNLKSLLAEASSKQDQLKIAQQLMNQYSNYVSDSALYYSAQCLTLAHELNDENLLLEIKLRRAYLLSFPELFHEAFLLLDSIDPQPLSEYHKALYYKTYLLVYHNQIKDLDDIYYRKRYQVRQKYYIDAYLSLDKQDDISYWSILAYKYYIQGAVQEAVDTVNKILNAKDVDSYVYAESLFNVGGLLFEAGKEYRPAAKQYLIRASIEYNKLAITRNPALMYLARVLIEEGDIDTAYDYMNIAIDDARLFSNRHRHSMAEKTYAQIQDTYYGKIQKQQESLGRYSILLSFLLLLLGVGIVLLYRHNRILKRTQSELSEAISDLHETSQIKETYIGHYLNQYSAYITKMDDYRKYIIRKLQTKQYEDLIQSELELQSKKQFELDSLFADFDNTFLGLYPHFIEKVNIFLKEGEHYLLKNKREENILKLNTELRILALLKLNIVDNKTIASFLRITVQTVYNYRSKIKSKAIDEESFEEDIKKINN